MANRNDAAVMVLHDPSATQAPEPEAQVNSSALCERPTLMGLAAVTQTPGPADATVTEGAVDAPAQPEPASEEAALFGPLPPPTSLPEDADAEWLDLSTQWLIAAGMQPSTRMTDESAAPEAPHWTDSLSAQVRPASDARGSAPPPPPKRRSHPPSQRASHGHTVPRHATLSGLQPAPGSRPMHDPDPWREEPSYTDGPRRHSARANAAASGYAAAASTLPPWASPYSAPPWAATPQPYAAAPWAAHFPTGAHLHASAAQRDPRDSSFEHWASLGNTWLTAVAKFAFAAMALHYSGLAEPLLAHFGYAHAAAATVLEPQFSDSMRRAALPTVLPLAPPSPVAAAAYAPPAPAIATAPAPAPTPAPTASARRAPTPKRTPSPRTAAATAQSDKSLQPAAAAPDPVAVGEAKLRINSRPWSQVFIDGTLVGHTPKIDLRVSAGPHSVRLVNPDLQLSKVVELHASAGETISRVELLSN